jgi:hypothetical protein
VQHAFVRRDGPAVSEGGRARALLVRVLQRVLASALPVRPADLPTDEGFYCRMQRVRWCAGLREVATCRLQTTIPPEKLCGELELDSFTEVEESTWRRLCHVVIDDGERVGMLILPPSIAVRIARLTWTARATTGGTREWHALERPN